MTISLQDKSIIEDIQHNCHISDARDHGIYSMCTMVLKLRNLYKWEHDLEPWEEAEPADLLDWIDCKENYWSSIADESFRLLGVNGKTYSPDNLMDVNRLFSGDGLVYGAGYGRSMKSVFFLADKLEERNVAGCPVIILGRERAREMASPFAMAQDGVVYIRRDSLRYFLWDQIQELRSSLRVPFRHTLKLYGLLKEGELDQEGLKEKLDTIVDEEMNVFIYHEVGEILQDTLQSATLEKIVRRFPGSAIELVCRSIKDILADTHPQGLLSYITRERRETSLGLYMSLLEGVRKILFPELAEAWESFSQDNNWSHIEDAAVRCRNKNMELAEKVLAISRRIEKDPDDFVQNLFNSRIIAPLGLDTAQ
ncbi:Sfum_1244 family protein [Desulfopila inferna]|uniref:Sfum_1244 family protein n=1 Tax=Desulfopila inferna TaxID=468528 RepID=UPI0019662274|nr:Sfum_1244 family protein [Desulfopila inferna]MBM9605565.1 hypothetical protein [Desulfopila inferna]